jgi:hypothetical protein
MIWVRKGIVLLLSLLLLVTLLGTASSTSTNVTLGKPDKVETYLVQSKLYDHFVAYVADQASKDEGGDQTGSVSLNDAVVQAAARSAFPPQLIRQGTNTFIDANYAWLEGKTTIPQFRIDLSAAKETFAQKVGRHVKTYTAGLPVCATAEAAQQQVNIDPLSATCRPQGVDPATVGALVTQRLSTTGDFLSDPVITANAINPKGNKQGRPYYQRFSKLPHVYRVGTKLPYVLGALSVLLALGIVFLALSRRRGLRRVGVILALAGVLLIASKFVSDYALKKAEGQVFNTANVGQLQKSLTDFAHRVQASLVKIDLWFGIAFLILALIIFGVLLAARNKDGKPKGNPDGAVDAQKPPKGQLPLLKARKRLARPFGDSVMPLGAKPGGAPEPPKKPSSAPLMPPDKPQGEPPKRRKPPRLIQ